MDPTEEMENKIDECLYEVKIITSIVVLNVIIGTFLMVGGFIILLKVL